MPIKSAVIRLRARWSAHLFVVQMQTNKVFFRDGAHMKIRLFLENFSKARVHCSCIAQSRATMVSKIFNCSLMG